MRMLKRVLPVIIGLTLVGLVALGTWQVQRLFAKLEQIERIETRIHADPINLPKVEPADAEALAYTRVGLSGHYLAEAQVRSYALTERGAGDWVMTPLQLDDGRVVYVNRGFVAAGADIPTPPPGSISLTGLLRVPEDAPPPFRTNQPELGRWYNRDVEAMAASAGLGSVVPVFVDADYAGEALPIGGMTQVNLPNNHLVYALTWYGLVLLLGGLVWYVRRRPRNVHAAR